MKKNLFEMIEVYHGDKVTAYNKAVREHGEYKKIADISDCGDIKFYVPIMEIPGKALLKLEYLADVRYQKNK